MFWKKNTWPVEPTVIEVGANEFAVRLPNGKLADLFDIGHSWSVNRGAKHLGDCFTPFRERAERAAARWKIILSD